MERVLLSNTRKKIFRSVLPSLYLNKRNTIVSEARVGVAQDDSETDRVAGSDIPPFRGGFGCLVAAAITQVPEEDES